MITWTQDWQDAVNKNRRDYAAGRIAEKSFIEEERRLHPWLPSAPFRSPTWDCLKPAGN